MSLPAWFPVQPQQVDGAKHGRLFSGLPACSGRLCSALESQTPVCATAADGDALVQVPDAPEAREHDVLMTFLSGLFWDGAPRWGC